MRLWFNIHDFEKIVYWFHILIFFLVLFYLAGVLSHVKSRRKVSNLGDIKVVPLVYVIYDTLSVVGTLRIPRIDFSNKKKKSNFSIQVYIYIEKF